MKRRYWSELEIMLLREVYPDHLTEAIAAVLDRSIGQVYAKAKSLGLKKSAAFIASEASGRIRRSDHKGRQTQFKPGQQPWNAGMTGWQAGGRSKETQFKKGSMSGAAQHNYVPIGTLRVTRDGILERKMTDDPGIYPARRWTPVARLVWEAANGPIPPRHMVVFKPGMHTIIEAEITVDRLECLSRAEHMKRHTLHNYPKEIVHAIQVRGALNRRINRVQKHQ